MNLAARTSPINITPARPDDAAACAAILSDWIEATDWMTPLRDRGTLRADMVDLIARGWVIVARQPGAVAGFLARDRAEIHALYVAGQARGQGIGQALLAQAKAATARLRLWTFQADTRARAFYQAEGFVETGRTDGSGNDHKLPDIRYEWRRA